MEKSIVYFTDFRCPVGTSQLDKLRRLCIAAGIQTIVGSMNPRRIADIATAQNVSLTRQEWYRLYLAAGNPLP